MLLNSMMGSTVLCIWRIAKGRGEMAYNIKKQNKRKTNKDNGLQKFITAV